MLVLVLVILNCKPNREKMTVKMEPKILVGLTLKPLSVNANQQGLYTAPNRKLFVATACLKMQGRVYNVIRKHNIYKSLKENPSCLKL